MIARDEAHHMRRATVAAPRPAEPRLQSRAGPGKAGLRIRVRPGAAGSLQLAKDVAAKIDRRLVPQSRRVHLSLTSGEVRSRHEAHGRGLARPDAPPNYSGGASAIGKSEAPVGHNTMDVVLSMPGIGLSKR